MKHLLTHAQKCPEATREQRADLGCRFSLPRDSQPVLGWGEIPRGCQGYMAAERTFWCQCWKGSVAKAQPSERIRTAVRIRAEEKRKPQLEGDGKEAAKRNGGLQREHG